MRTTRRIRIRSSFDVRWLLAMGFGLLVSIAYYAGLIWVGIWVVHKVMAWLTGH